MMRSNGWWALVGVAGALVAAGAVAAPATETATVYAAPAGTGTTCSQREPCAITQAQLDVRQRLARAHSNASDAPSIKVVLTGGTYRLQAPLRFTAADSGTPGHPVVWTTAPGAHVVLAGSLRVTDWKLTGRARNIWSAVVPAGLATRQLYIDGKEVPIAQTTPVAQGITFKPAPGGYRISPAAWVTTLQREAGADGVRGIEFVYTGGNGAWTQSRCRVAAISGDVVTMQQPCWRNVTQRAAFRDASGGLPSMAASKPPTVIENASAFLQPGQWYLDPVRHQLDYIPLPGQHMDTLDVEAPRLQTLIEGAGTLAAPVHDITFSGITLAYATWNAPSSPTGFAEVQDNLRLTGADPAQPQGTCTFSTPAGTCPFGALAREPGNVAWHAAERITFTGDTFTDLGAAALVFDHGSRHDLIEGNVFTGIAGNAVILGNTTDPQPADVGAGANEITAYNTIANNVIHNIGADYPGAAAITLYFTQHTRVAHNDLYNLPYDGITAGVIEGHVDNAAHPDESTSINSDNVLSDNLIHDFMRVLHDGGAIYMEGHQGQPVVAADGKLDRAASIAHGLTVTGNVAYAQNHVNNTWYDDAGTQWIGFHHNVEWGAGSGRAQGGCQATGYIDYTHNYNADAVGQWQCAPPLPVSVRVADNVKLPARPTLADLPVAILAQAGPTAAYRKLATRAAPRIAYVRASTPNAAAETTQVFIAGAAFGPATRVSFGTVPAQSVKVLATGLLSASAPRGADACTVTVTTRAGSASGKCQP